MRSRLFAALIFVLGAQLAGCIVSDTLTTLTIESDGSADLVTIRSNIRSTESGPKAEQELDRYKASFDARSAQEFSRVENAGGEIVESSWIRSVPPFSNFIHAHLPSAAVVESYLSEQSGGPISVTTDFRRDGVSRELRLRLESKTGDGATAVVTVAEQTRQGLADGISEFRVAITEGSIVKAEGFTVAEDRQSALLDLQQLATMLFGDDESELLLQWDAAD